MLNPILLNLAQQRVWHDASRTEKRAFMPPAGGAPPGGAMPPGMPPMDPAMMGGAPPAGGAMPPGMPPMDPMMMGGAMPPGMTPAAPAGAGAGGKPKFDPLMLDYRMYNLQQQLSAIMNALNIEVPPQALIMPPGTMGAPPAEQALPGGPMDPSQQAGGQQGSAISPIEPMQGASPELAAADAAGAGGAPKMASWVERQADQRLPADVAEFKKDAEANMPAGWRMVLLKVAEGEAQGDVDEDPPPKQSAPPNKALNVPGAPGTRPNTQSLSAGGSKDPKSRTEASDSLGPANKIASFGARLAGSPVDGAAALAAMMRSRGQQAS